MTSYCYDLSQQQNVYTVEGSAITSKYPNWSCGFSVSPT